MQGAKKTLAVPAVANIEAEPSPAPATFDPATSDTPAGVDPADIYEEALTNVRRNFVEINEFPLTKLDTDGLSRMYASLGDPHTRALTVERCKTRRDALNGKFAGIGATLTIRRTRRADVDYSHLTIVDVMPGSPAEKAGLRTGDRITQVDGRWIINYTIFADTDRIGRDRSLNDDARQQQIDQVNHKFRAGLSLAHALDQLLDGEGRSVTLTIERPDTQNRSSATFNASVTTALSNVDPVTFRLIDGKAVNRRPARKIAYLRVRQFNGRAAKEFTDVLSELAESTALGGLILDLRQNPGGVTSENDSQIDGYAAARKLISLLTSGGPVARIEHHPGHKDSLSISANANALHTKLVVLVDGGTANIAEMVAAALHDVAHAKLMGTHTFGDNILPLFARFKSGVGVELTTAHLYTLAGADLARGLEPDLLFADSMNDEQYLNKACSMMDL